MRINKTGALNVSFPKEEMDCFESPDIIEFYKYVAKYEFWIVVGEASAVKVGVRIMEDGSGYYHFRTSHHVHTPIQASPYHPSRTSERTLQLALDNAVSSIEHFYRAAKSEGHVPSEEWFIPNESY